MAEVRAAIAIALVAVAAAPARAEKMCISGPMAPQPIAGRDNEMAGTGGVIVASGTKLPDWRFRDMNRIVRPEVVTVAPGLAIYHPPPLPGTDVILEQEDHTIIAHRTRALKIDPPSGPPEIESIIGAPMQSDRRMVTAKLARNAPAHALIVIVSRVTGDAAVPMTWAMMTAGARDVQLWHTPFTCEQIIPTAVAPKPGDRVVLTWIDDTGRISEPSKPIVISGAALRK